MTATSRKLLALGGSAALLSLLAAPPAFAQEQVQQPADDETLTINILDPIAAQSPETLPPSAKKCQGNPDSESSEDEIVVCGNISDSVFYYSGNAEAAEDRYARETAFAGTISPPNVAGPGIFAGPASAGRLCGFGLNPCPPPPAYLINYDDLPDTPAGSDAARIANGLAPKENGNAKRTVLSDYEKKELGLPPPLDNSDVPAPETSDDEKKVPPINSPAELRPQT